LKYENDENTSLLGEYSFFNMSKNTFIK